MLTIKCMSETVKTLAKKTADKTSWLLLPNIFSNALFGYVWFFLWLCFSLNLKDLSPLGIFKKKCNITGFSVFTEQNCQTSLKILKSFEHRYFLLGCFCKHERVQPSDSWFPPCIRFRMHFHCVYNVSPDMLFHNSSLNHAYIYMNVLDILVKMQDFDQQIRFQIYPKLFKIACLQHYL